MIRLDNVSKQVGHQILFIEASAALQKGEKIGLVGPNGAGKTTLFRMIAGQEPPDEGQVSLDRGISIGYFSQDVGEMSGRSAVAEVMDGAGPVSVVAAELKELEAAMADPELADDMEAIIARYGEVQHRFEELDGYALNQRAVSCSANASMADAMYAPVVTRFMTYDVKLDPDLAAYARDGDGDARDAGMDRSRQGRACRHRGA